MDEKELQVGFDVMCHALNAQVKLTQGACSSICQTNKDIERVTNVLVISPK
jgi:hypothetical protein